MRIFSGGGDVSARYAAQIDQLILQHLLQREAARLEAQRLAASQRSAATPERAPPPEPEADRAGRLDLRV
jgi:hypothetical protein